MMTTKAHRKKKAKAREKSPPPVVEKTAKTPEKSASYVVNNTEITPELSVPRVVPMMVSCDDKDDEAMDRSFRLHKNRRCYKSLSQHGTGKEAILPDRRKYYVPPEYCVERNVHMTKVVDIKQTKDGITVIAKFGLLPGKVEHFDCYQINNGIEAVGEYLREKREDGITNLTYHRNKNQKMTPFLDAIYEEYALKH